MTLYSPDEMKNIVNECAIHGICQSLEDADIKFDLAAPDGKQVAVSNEPVDPLNHSCLAINVGGEVWGVLHFDLDADLNYVDGIVSAAENILSAVWGA